MALCMALEFYHSHQSGLGTRASIGSAILAAGGRARENRHLRMDAERPSLADTSIAAPVIVRDDVGIEAIAAADWNALSGGTPLVSHAFLRAARTGCASGATGWTPCYLSAWRANTLVGAMPLYAKAHSYGEYVFDWAWADAYHRHGRRYYPKLVAAIPFTPAQGHRLFATEDAVRSALIRAALDRLQPRHRDGDSAYSSLHVLFPTEAEARAFESAGMIVRNGLQFRWENPGFRDFADFLSTFNHDKRKKVKQERRKVAAAGVTFTRKVGGEITSADWSFFHRCYLRTYRDHHSTPYLNLEFFRRIGAELPGNVMLALGCRDGTPICAALDIFDADTLWGRYWGATEYVPGLHFEACYYQAIDFCIERRIARFEGGRRVRKLARGLVPVTTWSAHAGAVRNCARDRRLLREGARRRRPRDRRARRRDPLSQSNRGRPPMNDTVLLARDGPVATLTLNRPDALNALDPAMIDSLIAHTATVAGDDSLRVVVLRGAGRHFMAGGDIRSFAERLGEAPAVRSEGFRQ
jgi:predicted N-acyltransferase